MEARKHEYTFTHHLRERFVQRTNSKKYAHIQDCRQSNCETCKAQLADIRLHLQNNRRPIDAELNRRISSATESRSYLNNSTFMEWYYEKYGYDKGFQFLVHEDMLFIVIVEGSDKTVVTCISAKTHLAGKLEMRPKFNKIKKKSEQMA